LKSRIFTEAREEPVLARVKDALDRSGDHQPLAELTHGGQSRGSGMLGMHDQV